MAARVSKVLSVRISLQDLAIGYKILHYNGFDIKALSMGGCVREIMRFVAANAIENKLVPSTTDDAAAEFIENLHVRDSGQTTFSKGLLLKKLKGGVENVNTSYVPIAEEPAPEPEPAPPVLDEAEVAEVESEEKLPSTAKPFDADAPLSKETVDGIMDQIDGKLSSCDFSIDDMLDQAEEEIRDEALRRAEVEDLMGAALVEAQRAVQDRRMQGTVGDKARPAPKETQPPVQRPIPPPWQHASKVKPEELLKAKDISKAVCAMFEEQDQEGLMGARIVLASLPPDLLGTSKGEDILVNAANTLKKWCKEHPDTPCPPSFRFEVTEKDA